MGSKTRGKDRRSRQQRQLKKKVQQRRREPSPPSRGGGAGLSLRGQRLARLKPLAWEGERPEDVALFDDAVLETLTPQLQSQAQAVRLALRHAGEARGEEALECVAEISRSSVFSDWRLLIRGLVAWVAEDWDAASEAWKRLDPERRPGRIASALQTATRDDLPELSASRVAAQATSDQAGEEHPLDDALVYHAKLVHRLRFDRAAIRIARAELHRPEEKPDLKLGMKRLEWLRDFAAEYRTSEPQLVAQLERLALHRAFAQPYFDVFDVVTRAFSGPPHDRKNRLLRYFYYGNADDREFVERADRSLEQYLKELPQNQEISEPLRGALVSQIHLNEAVSKMASGEGFQAALLRRQVDAQVVRRHLQESVRAYPAHRQAYQKHFEWLEEKLSDDSLTKVKRAPLLAEQRHVMEAWSQALPDDVEPRLWLVDYLLENERTEEAKSHVDWLAGSRQEDPRVRAVPWKWNLLEAMRLSRRKAWLAEVPGHLDEAERQWPSWLSRQWLPYLRAAFVLRSSGRAAFEQHAPQASQEAGVEPGSLADACLMLGAAQRMRVAAADLKPLRATVDQAVKQLKKIPDDQLLAAASFFWDLQRTQLVYPAYRMHGGKFAKELWGRISRKPALVQRRRNDPQVQSAVLWCAEHSVFGDSYELTVPKWMWTRRGQSSPFFAAAVAKAALRLRYYWKIDEYRELVPQLREAAQIEPDPYYRHWFNSLADDLEEAAANRSRGRLDPFSFFGNIFGSIESDEDDRDDELDYDPDCNCPACRAAKRAHEAKRAK